MEKMKRTVCFLLALCSLFFLCACSASLAPQEVVEEEHTKEEKLETETEEPLPTGDIVYPEGFSVGYNRQSVADAPRG